MKLKTNKDYDIDDKRRCVYANELFGKGYIVKKDRAKFIGIVSLIPSVILLCVVSVATMIFFSFIGFNSLIPIVLVALFLWRIVDEVVYYILSCLPYFRVD